MLPQRCGAWSSGRSARRHEGRRSIPSIRVASMTAHNSTSQSHLACVGTSAGEGRSGFAVSSRPTGFLSFTTKRSIPSSTIDSVPSQAVGRRQCFAAFPVSRGDTPAHHSIAMTISASINPALVPNVIAKMKSTAFSMLKGCGFFIGRASNNFGRV